MPIKICEQAFDPWQEIQNYQHKHKSIQGKFGATNLFIGTMRDFNEGDDVQSMILEHYPGMTEKQLNLLVSQAEQQWPLLDTLIIHRVGEIFPNDPIVAVAVWTSHRGDAFDASRFIMETLKSNAPFWKKERLSNNQLRWVKCNTSGYAKTP